jgi:hypothetical protein
VPSLTSQLIVSLIDQVSGPAKKAAQALAGLGKATENIGRGKDADRLVKSLENVQKAAATASKGLQADWSRGFARQIDRLNLKAKDLDRIKQSWRDLIATLNTGGRTNLAAAASAMETWERRTLASLRRVSREQEQMSRAARAFRHVMAPYVTAYAVDRYGRTALEKMAELPREQARQWLAGMTPQETARAAALSRNLSQQFPSVGQVDIMERLRTAVGTFGDFHHAEEALPSIVRSLVVLSSLRGLDRAAVDLDNVIKGLEGAGKAIDPKQFQTILNAFVKGASLFGNTITGEDIRTYFTRAKASKYGLSEEYLSGVVPTMIQHETAAQFGTSQASAFSALIGGRQTKAAQAVMRRYGLLGRNGRVIAENELVSNPFEWATRYLKPHLAKKGLTVDEANREKLIAEVQRMFSNRNVGEFFTAMLIQEPVIRKDMERLKAAKGMEAAEELRSKDPFVALAGVKEQFVNFIQTIGGPHGEKAASVLNAIADAIGRLSKSLGEDPKKAGAVGAVVGGTAAVGGGYLSWLLGKKGWQWLRGGTTAAETAAGTASVVSKAGSFMRWLPWLGGAFSIATTPDIMRKTRDGRSWEEVLRERAERLKLMAPVPDYTFGYSGFLKTKPIERSPGFMRVPGGFNDIIGLSPLARTPVDELKRKSDEAGEAGRNSGQSFRQNLIEELMRAETQVRDIIGRIRSQLDFTARPSIAPMFAPASPAPAPSPTPAAARGLYSDYDVAGDIA